MKKVIIMLSLMTFLTIACKKEENSKPIEINELKDYYIVLSGGAEALSVIYPVIAYGKIESFKSMNKSNSLTYVGDSSIDTKFTYSNNTLNFYNGLIGLYSSIVFEKDNQNNIKIKSVSSTANPYKHVEMFKILDAPIFYRKQGTSVGKYYTYTNSNSEDIYIYFDYDAGNVWHWEYDGVVSNDMSFNILNYNLGLIKNTYPRIFGASVPTWKGNDIPTLLFISDINDPHFESGYHEAVEFYL